MRRKGTAFPTSLPEQMRLNGIVTLKEPLRKALPKLRKLDPFRSGYCLNSMFRVCLDWNLPDLAQFKLASALPGFQRRILHLEVCGHLRHCHKPPLSIQLSPRARLPEGQRGWLPGPVFFSRYPHRSNCKDTHLWMGGSWGYRDRRPEAGLTHSIIQL